MLNCFITEFSAKFKFVIEYLLLLLLSSSSSSFLLELQICEIWHSRKSHDEYFLLGRNAASSGNEYRSLSGTSATPMLSGRNLLIFFENFGKYLAGHGFISQAENSKFHIICWSFYAEVSTFLPITIPPAALQTTTSKILHPVLIVLGYLNYSLQKPSKTNW